MGISRASWDKLLSTSFCHIAINQVRCWEVDEYNLAKTKSQGLHN